MKKKMVAKNWKRVVDKERTLRLKMKRAAKVFYRFGDGAVIGGKPDPERPKAA